MSKQKMHELLEAMVDQANVSVVVERLADVCAVKAQNLHWEDRALARDWARAAKKLDACAAALHKEGL